MNKGSELKLRPGYYNPATRQLTEWARDEISVWMGWNQVDIMHYDHYTILLKPDGLMYVADNDGDRCMYLATEKG